MTLRIAAPLTPGKGNSQLLEFGQAALASNESKLKGNGSRGELIPPAREIGSRRRRFEQTLDNLWRMHLMIPQT